jgi:hypothetical protein
MFRSGRLSSLKTVLLAVALLAYSCAVAAQRGAGGGHTGGGLAGGGGLSGGGRSTGVDVKDDLKDYHTTLAVQATTEQIATYASMLKSTEAACDELRAFLEQIGNPNNASELAGRSATLNQAIEKARTENRKFLDGFSDAQKSGLKEITKSLMKDDSDLAQQTKELSERVGDAKPTSPPIAVSAQSLDRALTTFRSRQIDLGAEMSIGVGNRGQDSTFNLVPVKNSLSFGSQPITITTSGVVLKTKAEAGQNVFKLELTADLSDLQQNITEVLHVQLDKSDRCGEQVEVRGATLTAQASDGLVTVQLHYERWACMGRQTNELAEGNGTVEVKLVASVGEDGTLRLAPETGRVDAQGLVGESLRSGSLGDAVRDKVAEAVLSTLRLGGDFKTLLPSAAQGSATLQRVQFQGTGSGRIMVMLNGEIRVSDEKVTSLTSELKERSLPPETTQQTVSR